ncbi:MAG: hypothetical protein OHK006_17660 [Thermodesulfovibrionales bacterium]
MGFRIETSGEVARLMVDGDATINHAAEFRDALVRAAAESGSLVIDLNDVKSIDLTCLQLLCATHRSCSRDKKKISVEGAGLELLKMTAAAAGFPKQCGCFLSGQANECLWRNL